MDVVEALYNGSKDLDLFLLANNELSLKIYADANLRKNLLLASASYFEKEITSSILEFTKIVAREDQRLITFVEKKALSRQYHSMFDWNCNNCNAFLGLFGDEFKKIFTSAISANPELEDAVRAFMEIGQERNRMVHQDFGQYTLEKTPDEILILHKKAKMFVVAMKESLN